MEGLGQVVGNEAIVARQELAAVLRHLPAWDVSREAVHHCQVELGWERLEQVILIRVHDLLHGKVYVPDKTQAGIGDHFGAA